MSSSAEVGSNLSVANVSQELNASPGIRIFGATTYAIFSIISISLNCLLLLILFRGHKEYKKCAFYTIVWQQLICDLMATAVQLIVVVPMTYAENNIYGSAMAVAIIGAFNTFGYYGVVNFSFLTTLNRFTVFIFPRLNSLLFERPRIYWTITIVWCYVIFLVLTNNFSNGCLKNFSTTGFYLYDVCAKNQTEFGIYVQDVIIYTNQYFPLVMLVAYICIYLYIKITFSGNMYSSLKRDFTLLIQCFLICVVLEVENLSYELPSKISISGQWVFMINIVQNWLVILNNTINSIVLFIFNSEIRNSLRKLVKSKDKSVVFITAQMT